jgi:DNA repair exonuclease SbcCD ATPase subunit
MSRINYLDIDELNDRLSELEGLRDALESERENLTEATDEDREEIKGRIEAAQSDFGEAEVAELKALETLKDEIGEYHGKISTDGGPFVDERDFEDYARELAEEIGAIDKNASWPNTCIDWKQAAEELQMDYSSVEWNGTTYLYRS